METFDIIIIGLPFSGDRGQTIFTLGSAANSGKYGPSETGYLCAELTIYNFNNTEEELELVCNYKDKAGRVVGRSVRHISISKKSKFTEVFKWGNSSKSIWALGAYSVDIIFQDHVVASASIIMFVKPSTTILSTSTATTAPARGPPTPRGAGLS